MAEQFRRESEDWMSQMALETVALHGGYDPWSAERCTQVPIYQSAGYHFDDTTHAADVFALKQPGYVYARLNNPTNDIFEKRMAMLEGGIGALALSTGLAAIMTMALTICRAGDEIVSSAELYGGCYSLFAHSLKRLGIHVKFVPSQDLAAWEAAITDKTKFLYTETIGNPKLLISDLSALSALGRRYGLPLVVDNTMTTPFLLKPFDFGAAIVVHSTTKYIGGHGASMGGVIVDSGRFDWKASGRFPELTEPEPSYHGLRFWDAFKEQSYIVRARAVTLRDTGAVMAPFNAWLFLQGLETLGLRMERHCANAKTIAMFLEKHPMVSWVNYPGLGSSPTYGHVSKYLPTGQGAMLGFGIKGGRPAGVKFIESVRLFGNVANLGDAKSLVVHPSSTTHSQLNETEQAAAGVTPDFIRMSVGIENVNDLIADLEQALSACAALSEGQLTNA